MSARSRKSVMSPNQSAEDYSCLDKFDAEVTDKIFQTKKCISYICYLKEPSKILIDQRALNAFLFSMSNSMDISLTCFMDDDSFIEIISNICTYYYKDFKVYIDTSNSLGDNGFDSVLKAQYICFRIMLCLVHNLSNSSKFFRNKFFEFKGTQVLFHYINDDDLLIKLQNFKDGIIQINILESFIGSLNNLSLIAPNKRDEFDAIQAKQIVIKFINLLEDSLVSPRIKTSAYVALVNLITDDEMNSIPDVKIALSTLVDLIIILSDNLKTSKCSRTTIDFQMDDDSSQVSKFERFDIVYTEGLHLAEISTAVYRLAINDTLKKDIYNNLSIRGALVAIITHGNDWEKMFALKLLWQLCFDKEIARKIRDDKEFYELIIKTNDENSNMYVKKYSQGIIWSIKKLNEVVSKVPTSSLDSENKHIMISYNKNSRNLCLRIKVELEKLGHKVWIDVENIHGSTLEAMASAIENSKCVLICMTEDYKQSVYCRAEAEYTFTTGKPFIPLILQENYKPDGWLGIILGAKIFVNFTKYTFEECSKRLQNEIEKICQGGSENLQKVIVKRTLARPEIKQNIESWSNTQVIEWLQTNGTSESIRETLKNFDGLMLSDLNTIRSTAPDYFYEAISKNNTIDLYSVVKFNRVFKSLFQ